MKRSYGFWIICIFVVAALSGDAGAGLLLFVFGPFALLLGLTWIDVTRAHAKGGAEQQEPNDDPRSPARGRRAPREGTDVDG